MSKPVYHYWANIASRGHYVSYVLGFNGKLDDVEFKGDQPWPGMEGWSECQLSKTKQLPCLVDGDVSMGQGNAIVHYLCNKFDISQGLTGADLAHSEELIEQAADNHNALSKAFYAADRTAAMDALFGEGGGIPKALAGFEDHMGTANTPGDLCYAASLNLMVRLQADCLDAFPKTKAFYDAIQANEGVQEVNKRCPYDYFKRKSDE
jgi:glutathione S-transferase